MTATESKADTTTEKFLIQGTTVPTVERYFETLNAQNFRATAALFASDGVMHPPFESGIVGPDAIAIYLQTEAQDIKAYPHQGIAETSEGGQIQVQVTGKAQTSWCSINVLWLFILNPQMEILDARVKLLASPQELLSLRPDSNKT